MEFIAIVSIFSWLSILLFVFGIGFIIIEMYQPGFGLFGALGVICLIACILVTAQTVMQALILTVVFFVLILVLLAAFMLFFSKHLPKKFILHEAETLDQGFSGTEDMQYLMGKTGTVTSQCRPSGNADFDGVKLDVVSNGDFIEKGALIEVIEIEGNRIVVKEKN